MDFNEKVQQFKKDIIYSGIMDGEGEHHVFSAGMHGQKIDFDLISDDSELFKTWVELTAEFIKNNYDTQPEVVVGVANGTNRLAKAVADVLGNNVAGLDTYKPEGVRNQPIITTETETKLRAIKPTRIIVLEDVGTRGTNSASVCRSLKEAGFDNFEVINTWQRSETLSLLDEQDIAYKAIIKEFLVAYQPDECIYCKQGWKLKGHGK